MDIIADILVIVFAISNWLIFEKYQKIKNQYFNLLQQDSDFLSFVQDALEQSTEEKTRIKTVNRRYHIGILNAKIAIDKVKQQSGK